MLSSLYHSDFSLCAAKGSGFSKFICLHGYPVPGSVLGAGNTEKNKTEAIFVLTIGGVPGFHTFV
jgi:hypothetical protein